MKKIKLKLFNILFLTTTMFTYAQADCSYELFSISSTRDTKIIDLVEQLSDQCEFSIVITDPNAQQFLNKTLNKTHIRNLTLEEVLHLILEENNLAYKLEDNMLKISYLKTKTFAIDYMISKRKGSGSTDITLSSQTSNQLSGTTSSSMSGMGSSTGEMMGASSGVDTQSGVKIESTDEVKFWEELDKELQSVINRPEDLYKAEPPIINKNAGLITVTATQKQI